MAEAAILDTMPPLTPTTMRDRYVRLMKEYAAQRGKPTPELLMRIVDFQHQVAALGTSLAGSDARAEAQATINYWQTVRINAGDRPDTVLIADFDQEAARREAGDTPPYKGLAPFQTGDSRFFFSRLKLVTDLTDMVKSKRLLALVGLSGSGKSSVVRAGLIPNLAGRAYDGIDDDGLTDSSRWDYPQPLMPGADPVAALEAHFGQPIAAPADLVAALDARNTAVLVSVDQFEELFTLSPPGPRRMLFLDALVAAATSGVHRHVVVLTMRTEYKGAVTAHEAFNTLFMTACREVEAMQPSALRKVIEEPAQRLGVGFEPGLIEELLTRVQGEPAGLPLLGFTLLKLWEMRAGEAMKWADYETLGGTPRDILATSADAVYLGLELQQDRDLVQGIFTRLARIGDGFEATSSRVKRADLAVLVAQDSQGGALDTVLDKLATAGLIRTSPAGPMTPTTEIEVAHEALIRNWGRLTEWVKDRFAQQTTRKAFTLRAEKWKERGSAGEMPADLAPTGWIAERATRIPALAPGVARYQRWKQRRSDLLSGISLDEARAFPGLTPVEQEFIAASERHTRRRQYGFVAITAGFALLAGTLWVKTVQLRDLRDQERAETRLAALIGQSDQLIERGETALARKVLLAGLTRDAEMPAVVQAALQAAELNESDNKSLTAPHADAALGLSISTDGRLLMSLWRDGRARLWQRNADNGGWDPTPLILAVPGRHIDAVALSPDGSRAISTSTDRPATTVQMETWTLDPQPAGRATGALSQFAPRMSVRQWAADPAGNGGIGFASIKFAPNGERAVFAGNDGSAIVLDLARSMWLTQLGEDNAAKTVAIYSPNGDKILVADVRGSFELFDSKTFKSVLGPIFVDDKGITSARFTDTGARIAVGTRKGPIKVYSAVDGNELMSLPGHGRGVSSLAFAPDSTMIASGSPDGTVRLWEHGIASGRLLRTLTMAPPGAKPLPVTGVTFTPDGDTLGVATASDAIRLFDLNGRKLKVDKKLMAADRNSTTQWRGISRDRSVVVTETRGGNTAKGSDPNAATLTAWDTRNRRKLVTFRADNGVFDLAISPDGSRLAIFQDIEGKDSLLALEILDVRTNRRIAHVDVPTFLMASPESTAGPPLPAQDFPMATAFTADGRSLAMAMGSGRIMTWQGGNALVTLPLPAGYPHRPYADGDREPGLVASPSGPARFAFVGTDRRTAKVHDGITGAIIADIRSPNDIEVMRFTPDGHGLFIGTDVGAGAIHDATTGARRIALQGRHDNAISFMTFNANGSMAITASIDGTARLWDAETGALRHILVSPQGSSTASFSRNGQRVITGAPNRFATLWDVETGKKLTTLSGPLRSGEIVGWFAEDDRVVMTGSMDTTLRRWDVATTKLDYDDLFRQACTKDGRLSPEEQQIIGDDITGLPICNAAQARTKADVAASR